MHRGALEPFVWTKLNNKKSALLLILCVFFLQMNNVRGIYTYREENKNIKKEQHMNMNENEGGRM